MKDRTLTITVQPDWKGVLRATSRVAQAPGYQGAIEFRDAGRIFGENFRAPMDPGPPSHGCRRGSVTGAGPQGRS